jgi:hypothetical protein
VLADLSCAYNVTCVVREVDQRGEAVFGTFCKLQHLW